MKFKLLLFFLFLIDCSLFCQDVDKNSIIDSVFQKYQSLKYYQERGISTYTIKTASKEINTSKTFYTHIDVNSNNMKHVAKDSIIYALNSTYKAFFIDGKVHEYRMSNKSKYIHTTSNPSALDICANISKLSPALALIYPNKLRGTKLLRDEKTVSKIAFDTIDKISCFKIIQTRLGTSLTSQQSEKMQEMLKNILDTIDIIDSDKTTILEEVDNMDLAQKSMIEDTFWFRRSDYILIRFQTIHRRNTSTTVRISDIKPVVPEYIPETLFED